MARFTEKQIQEAHERLKIKVRRRFPLGCKVKMTREAERMFPAYAGSIGKVVGYERGISPKVLYSWRKTSSSWHPDFFKRVRP